MKTVYLALALAVLAACSQEAPPTRPAHRPVTDIAPGQASIGGTTVSLPQRIGEWTRPGASRRIAAETIFDYMDGGGELYLAYRFDHLDVFEYKANDAALGTLLVEIYSMKSPDDAFGLLSNDWGGEAVSLELGTGTGTPDGGHGGAQFNGGHGGPRVLSAVPPHRALYGAGLLRMRAGDRYVRILASRETPESRAAVLRLADAVMRGGGGQVDATAPPALLRAFDVPLGAGHSVRADRTCFFRSHLVLNSQYFLASQDILGLGLDVDAATTEVATGAVGARAERVIAMRYPSSDRAVAARRTFVAAYLPEAISKGRPAAAAGSAKAEHGWVAWAAKGQHLVIVLDASSQEVSRERAVAVLAGAVGSTSD